MDEADFVSKIIMKVVRPVPPPKKERPPAKETKPQVQREHKVRPPTAPVSTLTGGTLPAQVSLRSSATRRSLPSIEGHSRKVEQVQRRMSKENESEKKLLEKMISVDRSRKQLEPIRVDEKPRRSPPQSKRECFARV